MPKHKALNRKWMIRRIASFAKKYYKLEYPFLVVKALSELYRESRQPDPKSDPNVNFSNEEAIKGFTLGRGVPLANEKSPLDLRMKRLFDAVRRTWNHEDKRRTTQLYIEPYPIEEIVKRRGKEPLRQTFMYDFLQVTRGRESVGKLDKHVANVTEGLNEMHERIQESKNIRSVDTAIQEVLSEIDRIMEGE